MASQIEEDEDEDHEESTPFVIDSEAQKNRVRQIIKHQKRLYYSSSSSSSSSAGASSSSYANSPRRSSSLLGLMKKGSTSLGRLFDMEHTSLKTYLNEYSGSPMIKPIFLWGSDSDDANHHDPWISIIKRSPFINDCTSGVASASVDGHFRRRSNIRNRRLTRKRSFRRLPRFRLLLWIFSGFRFRMRLRRLRVMICGRKF